jgi:tetratricopeptide (TPR) repeat protein
MIAHEHPMKAKPATVSDLIEELLPRPVAARQHHVRNVRRYWTPAVCRALLDRSQMIRFSDPFEMARIALLGVISAEHCTPADDQLLAEAWTQFASGLMVRGTLRAADKAFVKAGEFLPQGNIAAKLRWVECVASLRLRQGRLREARQLIDDVLRYRADCGEAHAYASGLCQSALIFSEAGDPVSALAETNRALELIDGAADPQLLLVARHNGARFLIEMGHARAAFATLHSTEALYQQAADPMMLLRQRWVYAQAAAAFGTAKMDLLAEREFRSASDEAIARGLPYEAASILLELGVHLAVRRRYMLLPGIVDEIIPLFDAMGIGPRGSIARRLRTAAEDHHLAAELFRGVAAQLRRRRR